MDGKGLLGHRGSSWKQKGALGGSRMEVTGDWEEALGEREQGLLMHYMGEVIEIIILIFFIELTLKCPCLPHLSLLPVSQK